MDHRLSPRDRALAQIDRDPALRALMAIVRERQDGDPGHDLQHALRVAGWTLVLAPENAARDCVAAALLHDLVNVPKDDPRRAQASAVCAEEARKILPAHGFDAAAIDRVAEAIEDHSYSRGATPRSSLGDALQDADRLEALGALGIMRTISCGTRMGAAYFHALDPWARDRPLDDRAYSIDHFFTKLLRLPETMRTAGGREEARRRVDVMRAFLDQLAGEIGIER
jgi:uncharacterized protein